MSTLSCLVSKPNTDTARAAALCDREVSVGRAIAAGVRQPGHTDTASPHQRECINLDGAATASARRVRAERKLERPVQAVCSTELSTRSCLASEPAAHGTGAVALASSEGRGFHIRHGSTGLCERKLETPVQAGALSCVVHPELSGKRARHIRTECRCTVTREAFTDGAATATCVCRPSHASTVTSPRCVCSTEGMH